MSFDPMKCDQAFAPPVRLSLESAWVGHIPFAQAAVQLLRPGLIVELGTHAGDSYLAFCRVVAELGLDTQCFAVDTWEGDDHTKAYGSGVLPELRAFHDPRYGAFSTLLQTKFDDARGQFKDGSIDLLHIDGLHTYEAVRHDFESWLPAMSPRGVILFHDVTVRVRDFGVWKLWDEIRQRHPHVLFEHSHGLGVLAVGSDVPAGFMELVNDPEAAKKFFTMAGTAVEGMDHRAQLTRWLFWLQGELDRAYRRANVPQLPVRPDAARIHADPIPNLKQIAMECANVLNQVIRSNGPAVPPNPPPR